MKKILSVILTLSLVASLFACNTFSVIAAKQKAQATETFENVVVNHYTDVTTMQNAAGIKSLQDDADITAGSVLLNGGLANDKYTFTNYTGTTASNVDEDAALKTLASDPYSEGTKVNTDLDSVYLKRTTATKTYKGTSCNAYAEGRDSKGYFQIYASGEVTDTNKYGDKFAIEYLDVDNTDENARGKAVVEYNVGEGSVVSDLVIAWAAPQYRAGYYVVLTSADGKKYNEQYRYMADKIGTSGVKNSVVQHIKLTTPVFAKYVQIHFYSAINSVATANFKDMIVNNSTIRLRTLQIFGTHAFTFDDHDTYSNSTDTNDVISAATDDTYEKEVFGTKTASLVAGLTPTANYFVASDAAVGTSFDNGDGTLKDTYTYDTKTALEIPDNYAKRFTDGSLFAGDLVICDDLAIRRMFVNLNMKTNDSTQVLKTHLIDDESKQWVQLDYDLGFSAEVSQFTLVGKTKPRFNASHYKYYASETAEGLYDEKNCVAEVTTPAAIGSVTLTTPKTARYVGIRLISIHNTELHTGLSLSSLYSRATEFAVFGTHGNAADAEVTITTEEGVPTSLINKGQPAYSGKTDSYGKYAAGTVNMTATDYYEDIENKKSYTFKGWYNGEELVSANGDYTYDLTGEDITLTAKYDVAKIATKYTLTFKDATRTVVGTVIVEEGNTVDMALVNGFAVKDIYGYKVYRDEQENVIWDTPLDVQFTSDMEINALYVLEQITTNVTVYNIDGTVNYQQTQRFDTVINLNVPGASSYEDAEGNVIVAGTTGMLYACGAEMNIYAKATVAEAPQVTIVGKDMKNGNFTVFAHCAPEGTAKAYGILFASSNYKANYDVQSDKGVLFTLEDTEAINKAKPSLKVSEMKVANAANVDFMATLTNCGTNIRYARAYITYADGTTVYSDIIVGNK